MSSFLDPCNDTGSPSMSRTEDNLSNSDGPLLKRSVGNNNSAVSSDKICGTRSVPTKDSSRLSHRRNSDSSESAFESTRKRYCLWALTFVLAVVGLSNLLLSVTIIAVLRVSQGMEAMEVIPEENLVKFYGRTDLDKVCVEAGVCQSYGDEPLELRGDDGGVEFTVRNQRRDDPRSNLRVLRNGTSFASLESFELKDSRTGSSFFSTDFPNFGLPSGVGKIAVKLAETHRIVSPVNSSLSFESNRQIGIHGAESARIESKTIVWMADNDLRVKSNKSLILDAKNGIYLDVTRIPLAATHQSNGQTEVGQFKVCVCMPQGKLFRVPVPPGGNARVNCAKIGTSPLEDPCQ